MKANFGVKKKRGEGEKGRGKGERNIEREREQKYIKKMECLASRLMFILAFLYFQNLLCGTCVTFEIRELKIDHKKYYGKIKY